MKDKYVFRSGMLVLILTISYCIYMGMTHSFDARCARVYDRNTAAHELCVARTEAGGPVFEENIGKM